LPTLNVSVTGAYRERMHAVNGLDELRGHGRMTWIERERGWVAAPDDVVNALSSDGFEQCTGETPASHRDLGPAGGMWHGVNPHTGSVASAIWVTTPARQQALVFIDIDGTSVKGDRGEPKVARAPYTDEGGEG
jgi:hypothetical protein